MAETIFSAVVLVLCASPLIILGIVQYRSKEPVGFWAGKEPLRKEEITNVSAYNRKHGLMWILYGLGLIACFVCGVPFGGLTAAYLCMAEVFGGLFGMIAYHNRLNRMYDRKRGDK